MGFSKARRTKQKRSWIAARDGILEGADIGKINEALSHLSKEDIENTYEDEKNLLHFAIRKNKMELVKIFFEKGFFLPPHTCRSIPYVHVACAFGHCDIVKMLYQHRGLDKKILVSIKEELWMKCVGISPKPSPGYENYFEEVSALIDSTQPISAHEIASLFANSVALQHLLPDDPTDIYNELIKEDKAGALLSTLYGYIGSVEVDDGLDEPFEVALYYQSPRCLDVILRYAAKYTVYLAQFNPYHFMYTFGSYKVSGNGYLAECTRLLIEHDMNVNAVHTASSFPLYCFLLHINRCYDLHRVQREEELKILEEHFAILKMLLQAGADPSFDEKASLTEDVVKVRHSKFQDNLMKESESKEKQYYSNATHILVELIRPNASANLIDFVHRSFSLLKDHGCNMKGNRSMLGQAIKTQNEKKLENFLKFFDFNEESLDYAFEKSLYHVSPGCLEVMLKYSVEHDVKFRQQNPFHFLSACDWGSGPAHKCVRLLISFKYDVNKMVRRHSHPLYTMLYRSVDCSDRTLNLSNSYVRHILTETCKCLKEMLAAGANPNFSEYSQKIELHHISALEASLVYDFRDTFEHCAEVVMCIIANLEEHECLSEFLKKSVNILLAHGCDFSLKTSLGQSVLHAIFESFPFRFEKYQYKIKKVRKHVKDICQLVTTFLLNGCDIQLERTIRSRDMPLGHLCDQFYYEIRRFLNGNREFNDEQMLDSIWLQLKPFLKLFDIMEVKEATIVIEKFIETVEYLVEDNYLSVDTLQCLTAEFQSHLRLRSLYHSCLIKVWRCCDFRMKNVNLVGLPWNVTKDLEALLTLSPTD